MWFPVVSNYKGGFGVVEESLWQVAVQDEFNVVQKETQGMTLAQKETYIQKRLQKAMSELEKTISEMPKSFR